MMGEARRRGDYETRKAEALKAGRKKVPTVSPKRLVRDAVREGGWSLVFPALAAMLSGKVRTPARAKDDD